MVVGFLFAGALTDIQYACRADEAIPGIPITQCVSFEKAIMHPRDLITNTQNSLVQFSATFAVSSLFTFVIVTVVITALKKHSHPKL